MSQTPPQTSPVLHIAVLLTCHNRRDKTIRCLQSLRAQVITASETLRGRSSQPDTSSQPPMIPFQLDVYLVDDGSADGTTAAVKDYWPNATILSGDGSLYWCGGMRLAWKRAAQGDPDYYLLLNDDTILDEVAIITLLEIVGPPNTKRIAVAAIRDPVSGRLVYGGARGLHFQPVNPTGAAEACDTMNTNCALVPRRVFEELGMFHEAYTHAMGDFDYGFQATRRGIPILQSGRFLGSCPPNLPNGTWRDRSISRKQRWHQIMSPKGLPPREWAIFTRRNLGRLWVFRFVSPYLRVLIGR